MVRVGLVVLMVVLVVGWLIYKSAQTLPEFYQTALEVSAESNSAQGDLFETKVIDLQNAARTKTAWQAAFTSAEINGWLATDLMEKFPESLPAMIVDPRIAIGPNQLKLAVKYRSSRLSAIIVAAVDVFSTDSPGQIAVRIEYVRAGWLPIPVASIADRVSESLRRSGIRVVWTEMEGTPVALLTLPADFVKLGGSRVELEAIQLLDESLVLTGTSALEEENP